MNLIAGPIPYEAKDLEEEGVSWLRWQSVQICSVQEPVKEHLVVLQVDTETWVESGDRCSVRVGLIRSLWGPALMLSLKLDGSWCQQHVFRAAGNPFSDLTEGFLRYLETAQLLQVVAFGHRSRQSFGRWFLKVPDELREAVPQLIEELHTDFEPGHDSWSDTIDSILTGHFGVVADLTFELD